MLYSAITKVPGGKMIRVKVDADAVINAVSINGDFFLHPEESLPAIEKSLIGHTILSGENDSAAHSAQLSMLIRGALAREKAAFLGVSPEDIARTVTAAFLKPSDPSAIS